MRLALVVIFSLIVIFELSYAFAEEVMFDQTIYVNEHSGVLTIIDSSVSSNEIENVRVSSGGEQIWVDLYRIGNSDSFKSNFINFTVVGESDDGISPALKITETSAIDVEYVGIDYLSRANMEKADNPFPSGYNSIKTFSIEANLNCHQRYDVDNDQDGDDDKDFICDKWENQDDGFIVSYPTQSDYKLPCDFPDYSNDSLGTKVCPSLDKKDIYIEIDYMAGHYPNVESLEKVVEAFQNAPGNPINLHITIDEKLPHINQLDFHDPMLDGFHEIKAQHFGTISERGDPNWDNNEIAKAQVFYYYLWAHDQTFVNVGSSGISEESGNDGAVTLGSFDGMVGSTDQQAGSFMHELGHNLGIDHGGSVDDQDNCKPNLLSVMTYSRQFSEFLERPLDYSRQSVGNQINHSSLGMEHELNDQDGISGYPNCPFVSSTNENDLDFDGIVDVCDSQTIVNSDTTPKSDTSLFGDLIIENGSVLTINPGTTVDFDMKNQNVTVRDGGGILIHSGGGINGFVPLDSNQNEVLDSHENLQMVFGDENNPTRVEHTQQLDIIWPSEWKNIRYISDINGNWVCPPPENVAWEDIQPVELDSVDQWSEINLSRESDYWTQGRSVDSPNHQPISLNNQPSNLPIIKTGLEETSSFNDNSLKGNPSSNISSEPSGDKTVTIKQDSGNKELFGEGFTCDDCFSPSVVSIPVGKKVTWVNEDNSEPHSITTISLKEVNQLEENCPYCDYTGELNNNIFMEGQTFSHTFDSPGLYPYQCIFHSWMKGTVCVGPDCKITPTTTDRFDLKGKWCLTETEVNEQITDNPGLNRNRAPLCSDPSKSGEEAIKMDNVRAARSVNVDNVLVIINKLDIQKDFASETDKNILIADLEKIRELVWKDQMPEVLDSYINLTKSVQAKITNEEAKQKLLDALNRNIKSSSNSVPEFETFTILILIFSTIIIVTISRKMPLNSIFYK